MRKEIVETGRNVDVAIESACEKLGCNREDCGWEIIDLPKKTFLGLKTVPAKVKVWIDLPDEKPKAAPKAAAPKRVPNAPPKKDRPAPKPKEAPAPPKAAQPPKKEKPAAAPTGEINQNKVETARTYIAGILKAMNLDADLSVKYEDGGACINIEGQGLGMIIGRRGETLDAIQYLTSLVANREEGDYLRITIDCGDYRTKRQETLESLAGKLASQVLKTNVSKTLEPMNPFERRIIHSTVSEIEGVSSMSIGEEPNRRVVITSPTARPAKGGRGGGRGGRPGGGGDRRGPGGRGGDRRPPRRDHRDGRGGDRRSGGGRDRGPRPTQPVQEGPPKQTPEATASQDKPLYTKIELD